MTGLGWAGGEEQQGIVPVERFGVGEDGGRLLERDAVLFQVAQGLPGVPGEHITVYTLIRQGCKEKAGPVERAAIRRREIPLCAGRPHRRSDAGRESRPASLGMTVRWVQKLIWQGRGESIHEMQKSQKRRGHGAICVPLGRKAALTIALPNL